MPGGVTDQRCGHDQQPEPQHQAGADDRHDQQCPHQQGARVGEQRANAREDRHHRVGAPVENQRHRHDRDREHQRREPHADAAPDQHELDIGERDDLVDHAL
jgi:hypothetical protein